VDRHGGYQTDLTYRYPFEWGTFRMSPFATHSLIKSTLVRNCFVGVTVVHRSGIFSTSDILGDVAGGSDWYTAHIECLR